MIIAMIKVLLLNIQPEKKTYVSISTVDNRGLHVRSPPRGGHVSAPLPLLRPHLSTATVTGASFPKMHLGPSTDTHTVQVILLKSTIQWFLVHSLHCATIIIPNETVSTGNHCLFPLDPALNAHHWTGRFLMWSVHTADKTQAER